VAPWNVGLPDTPEQHLRRRVPELGFEVGDDLVDCLLAYLELLQRWNKAYNLTAVRDPVQMVYKHLLDSLAIAPFLGASMQRIIDVGTGAGLPGVPLALLFPEREFTLLDSNGKKTRFLFQVKTELGLDNMSMLQGRAEQLQPDMGFDAVLSRAFATLGDMIDCCRQLCAKNGRFLAMKGAWPEEELALVAATGDWTSTVYRVPVPGLDEERHLVEISSRINTIGE
jgi:16S rRNA (guanine527-N7)-methyltransferase